MRVPWPGRVGARAALLSGTVAVLGVGGLVAASLGGLSAAQSRTAPPGPPPPPAAVTVVGERALHVTWAAPLRIRVDHGRLVSVQVRTPAGPVAGLLAAGGMAWSSYHWLFPSTTYRAELVVRDERGRQLPQTLSVRTTPAPALLVPTLSPGDGAVVGIGEPAVVYFNRWVTEADRAAVERRLTVTTSPVVGGAWHWFSGQEVHWRPPTYWHPGTRVHLVTDLRNLYLGHGVWGSGMHEVTFTIGAAHVSIANAATHQMVVMSGGKVIRTMPISAGRDKYPTMSGVHITLDKAPSVIMNSATVGIPVNSPDGYYETVYWDVRISDGGEFVHAAPWSVNSQGRTNVSHGCINISPANAQWFYYFSQIGDVVEVLNTGRPANSGDPGTADWNMSWNDWLAGDALR